MLAMRPGFGDFYNALDDFFSDAPWPRRDLARDTFKIDVEDTGDAYNITAELPGIAKNEIDVEMDDEGHLTIAVERKEEKDDSSEDKKYIHRERRIASMSRGIYLGDADPAGISAKLDNGILSLEVKKEDKSKHPVKIDIQ
jgi:HSP20 family protein